MPIRSHYRRHLPHQVPEGYPIFLTWNLKGAFPRSAMDEVAQEEKRLQEAPLRKNESNAERKLRISKQLFAMRDRILGNDCGEFGHSKLCSSNVIDRDKWMFRGRSMWLADPMAACEVAISLLWGVPDRYQLWAFVVMGNHVHCLLTPEVELEVVTQGIKGYTAYQINGLQEARGRVFWQDESFDRWPRDEDELFRIIDYIEKNPVVAGLCKEPEDWRWSSSAMRRWLDWPLGQPFPVTQQDFATQRLRQSAFLT